MSVLARLAGTVVTSAPAISGCAGNTHLVVGRNFVKRQKLNYFRNVKDNTEGKIAGNWNCFLFGMMLNAI